ncbi:MAG: ion transporter [Acidobacteriota bacterium]
MRHRLWEIVEAAKPGDRASRVFDISILSLILLNVIAVIIGTVPVVDEAIGGWLLIFEIVSVTIFIIEYLVRLWVAPEDPRFPGGIKGRIRWALSPMAIIDFLAIVPSLIPLLPVDMRCLRIFRLLRIIRLAKAGRYFQSLRLMGNVFKTRREELILTTLLMTMLLVISASAMYYVEHDAQPEAFPHIPATLWWAVATLTTVGYGDVYPITGLGRFVGALAAIFGIGIVALPTGILGAGFIEELQHSRQPVVCPKCGASLDGTLDSAD